MKNVQQKAPKNNRGTAFRLVIDLTSHMRSWKCFVNDSPGIRASVRVGKISSSVTEISV